MNCCERNLIPYERWKNYEIPLELVRMAIEEMDEGYPTGIGFDGEYYYVLQSSGQGPYFIWGG